MSKNNVKEVFSWIKSIVIALVIVVGVRHFYLRQLRFTVNRCIQRLKIQTALF